MTQQSRRTCCNSKLGGDASRSSTRCGGKAVQGLRLDSRRWGPSTPQLDSQANHAAPLRMTAGSLPFRRLKPCPSRCKIPTDYCSETAISSGESTPRCEHESRVDDEAEHYH